MSTFLRASNPQADLQAMAVAAFGASGIVLPVWYLQDAWSYPLSGLVLYETPVSGLSPAMSGVGGSSAIGYFIIGESQIQGSVAILGSVNGFCAAMQDGASGVYLCQHSGSLIRYASGGALTAYNLEPGLPYTGGTYLGSQNAPYILNGAGSVYTLSGTGSGAVLLPVANGFGVPAYMLHGSGSTLFTIEASVSGIGTLTLSSQTSGVSGFILAPIQDTLCLAIASGGGSYPLAIGGWNQNLFVSGFTAFAQNLDSATSGFALGVASGTGTMSLWNLTSGAFTFNQAVTGLGAPSFVLWSSGGTFALVCDPVNGNLYNLAYTLGLFSLTQTIVLSGATQVALTPAMDYALVTQPALNRVSVYHASGISFVSGATLALSGATSVLSISASGMAIGFGSGSVSGIAYANLVGSGWSISATGSLPFIPANLAQDEFGNIYAVGSMGSSGYVFEITATTVTASASWNGSGNGVIWEQGQIVVSDIASSLLGIFEPAYSFGSDVLSLVQANAYSVASGLAGIGFSSPYLMASTTSGQTLLYQFGAPYSLFPEQSGVVSIYNASGSTWTSVGLGALNTPETVAFDPSGNISAVTLQNNFFTISPSGASILASSGIPQGINQPQTTPIGSSKLLWFGGHLYAATSLNDSLVEVI